MNTFVEKDPIVKALLKEERLLHKKRNSLNRKMIKRVEKLLSSRIPDIISSHRWVISEDFYSSNTREEFKYSLCFRIFDEEKEDVCSSIKLPGLPAHNLRPRKVGASKVSPYKKAMKSPFSISKINSEIKTWRDLSRVCEHWDIHLIKFKNDFLSVGERSFRLISNDGLDAVFTLARDLGMSLDMRSCLAEIQDLEFLLERKKKLMSELSSKMLFSV